MSENKEQKFVLVPVAKVTEGTAFGPGLTFIANGQDFPKPGTLLYAAAPTAAPQEDQPVAQDERDNCQFCLGAKGGVRGNENRYGDVVVCDYCSVLLDRAKAPTYLTTQPQAQPASAAQPDSEREFAEWLNARRDWPVAEVFHDTVAKYRAALIAQDDSERKANLNYLLSTMDAKQWTDEYCKRNTTADHGTMLAWFASAIMAGYDEGQRRAALPAPQNQEYFTLPELGHVDANRLEQMAKERPDECFLKGSGVLKLTGAIRQLEAQVRALTTAHPAQEPVISFMSEGASEERIKTLMAQVGIPNSMSLYQAFKQFQNEIEQATFLVPAQKPEGKVEQQGEQPKLTLALPAYDKRRIVIVSDEIVDGDEPTDAPERLVCVAIEGPPAPQQSPKPREIKRNSDFSVQVVFGSYDEAIVFERSLLAAQEGNK